VARVTARKPCIYAGRMGAKKSKNKYEILLTCACVAHIVTVDRGPSKAKTNTHIMSISAQDIKTAGTYTLICPPDVGRVYFVDGYWYFCSASQRIADACPKHCTRKGAVSAAKAAGFTKIVVERFQKI